MTDTLKAELTPEEKKVLEVRNLRSNLYVLLLYKDQCIGVLISSNADEVYAFSEEIIELSKILAGQSALAIIETRRTAELKQRLEEIEQKNDELQQTQKTLRQSEKKLSDILRFAETIAFVTTDDNEEHPCILDFSPGAEKIFGYKKEEVLGKEVAILHTDEDVKRFPEVIQALRHKQEGFSGESILVRKNGEHFPALFKTHPMNDEQGNMEGTIGVSIDITELKQAEVDKSKLQEQLAQSQKMEAVGQLAGGVAHDFNNMLSVILGYTDMLIEQLSASDQLSELLNDELQEVHAAAERSAGLTRQLLAFSRQQTIAPEIVDLNKVISDLLNMLRRLIGEDIELSWIPGENLGKLLIDPSQIDQVLVNLSVNAREAISDTGRITIETSRVILTEEYCSTHAECSPGDYILLAVSDNGCGMEKEILSHIMEPFFTTKGPGKGTGLGLPTVFGIVKQNKGLIYVYSEPDQGTSIKIYLPTAKREQKTRSKSKQLPAARGSETILLADDDEMLRNLAVAMLKQLGYRVFAAASPQQASALIKEHKDIVLLITDVVMPEMNGKKLFETLKTELPHLQCLFMSGYTSNVIVHRGIVDEGVNFIQKPFSKQDLSIKIRQVLNLPPPETSK